MEHSVSRAIAACLILEALNEGPQAWRNAYDKPEGTLVRLKIPERLKDKLSEVARAVRMPQDDLETALFTELIFRGLMDYAKYANELRLMLLEGINTLTSRKGEES